MTRALAPLLALLLAGCGLRPLSLLPARRTLPVSAAPRACPPDLLADLVAMPRFTPDAWFPAPETAEEKDAVRTYLQELGALGDHDRAGWDRAADAKRWCEAAK